MKNSPVLTLLLIIPVVLAAADQPQVVPVHEEPRHRLVFEKGDIRIFNTSIPAGDMSLFHHHQNPTLYVVLNGSSMRNQNLGEEWSEPSPEPGLKIGTFLFRDYREKPQTHRVDNVGHQSFQVIGVINRGEGKPGPARHPDASEVDNPWFSGYRYKLSSGASTDVHTHNNPVFIVQVSNGNSIVIERGFPTAEKTVAGTWSWHDAGVGHQLRNIGSTEVELVEFEIK